MATAIAIALVGLARPALAQDPSAPSAAARATARALMDEGFDRKDRGDLRGALDEFTAADALVHAPTSALEAARVEEALGELVEARNRVEAILDAPQASSEPREFTEARAAASRMADDLDARIPRVRFAFDASARDASLAIDGEAIPRAARDVTHRLDPGAHAVVARAPSGRETRVAFTVRERETRAVGIAIAEPPAAAPAPPAAPAAAAVTRAPSASTRATPLARATDRTLAYASFGVAGAGLVVGVVAGAVALAHRDAAATQCNGSGVCPSTAFHDLDAAQTASTIADAGFAVALVGAAVGVADLFLVRDRDPSTATTARPYVSLGGAGIRGSF